MITNFTIVYGHDENQYQIELNFTFSYYGKNWIQIKSDYDTYRNESFHAAIHDKQSKVQQPYCNNANPCTGYTPDNRTKYKALCVCDVPDKRHAI